MRALEQCETYQQDIKRLTKSNSFVYEFNGLVDKNFITFNRVIYIVKKDVTGKAVKVFVAYDYESKVKLAVHWDKEKLVEYVKKQDLNILKGMCGD